MTRLLVIVFMTALGFAAGYGVRIWTECHPGLPGPPVPFLGEFWRSRTEPPGGRPINRAELIAHIQGIRQQLDAFQARKDEIDAQFDRDFDAVLNAEQRAKHADAAKHRHAPHSPADDNKPISEDRLVYLLREQPGRNMIGDVVIPWRLDSLTRDYKLDDGQRDKVRVLLRVRREAFFELVDSSPPPSVILYRLAPLVERIAQPHPPDSPPPPLSDSPGPH
jgi:hypothetical protein